MVFFHPQCNQTLITTMIYVLQALGVSMSQVCELCLCRRVLGVILGLVLVSSWHNKAARPIYRFTPGEWEAAHLSRGSGGICRQQLLLLIFSDRFPAFVLKHTRSGEIWKVQVCTFKMNKKNTRIRLRRL